MEEESDDKDDTKRKSRNLSEKKRRDQFNSLVNDLSALISTSNRKMDKSTVLKSTIAFLKHHNEATDRSKVFEIQKDWKPSFLTNDEFTHLMLEALDGFIIVFSSSGSIYYASESIISLLGYLPSDLLNMTIFDLTYEVDRENLLNIFLNPTPVIEPLQTDITASNQITFHAHMKRGGIDKVDANDFELVKFVGYFRNDANVDNLPVNTQTPPRIYSTTSASEIDKKLIFVGTGRVQKPQLIREMSVIDPTQNEFTSKHSMEWKFLFLDHRAPPIIGYMPFEVLGTSGYDYYHFDDLDGIVACHEELLQKGEGKSCYYRFITKGQQWLWLQTDFFVSYHQYNSKPDYVVCTHKVVSYGDVIKQNKSGNKSNKTHSVNVPALVKTSTVTLKDLENTNSSNGAVIQSAVVGSGSGAVAGELNDASSTLDAVTMWQSTAATNSATPMTPLKSSRPSSSYGNISSTGVSPNVKRKRYFHHSRGGNGSDSTSMSADSATSRHSLLTHISSQSRQRQSMSRLQQQQTHVQQQQSQSQLQQQQQQQQQTLHQQTMHQSQQHPLQMNQAQQQQKLLPMLQQHSIAGQMMTNSPCQFTQPTFPLSNAPLVGPTFLEPPQFLTAIPVQPVITPFSVAPVLSPISHHQSDMLSSAAVIMTPTQTQLQDQLQRKHDELQKLIMQQQNELRIVSEQLLLARYTMLQPMVPLNYNNASGGSSRNFNFTNSNNSIDQQFNQYGFAMNYDIMQSEQEQQQQQQQQQQLMLQRQQQAQLQTLQQQPQLPTQQQLLHNSQQQQQAQHQQQHAQQQQQPQSLLSRSVPDLEQFATEEIDAFLNLSPLQSISSQTGLNQSNNNNSTTNTTTTLNQNNSNNNANNNSSSNQQNPSLNHSFGNSQNAPQPNNEDSLLSYMQMTTDPSSALNFQMGISDDGSETHNDDAKLLHNHSHHHQQQQQQHHHQQQQSQHPQQQQQNRSFFSNNPFQSLNQSGTSNQMANDLEILSYQMSQEQSQKLFNLPHTPGPSQ